MPLWAFAAATGLREVPEQGLPGPPRGPASPPPGLEQDKGWEQLKGGGALSPGTTRRGCCWDSRTPTFTAGFLQRHQILGHSSRAQPASLVVSPVQGGETRAAYSAGREASRQLGPQAVPQGWAAEQLTRHWPVGAAEGDRAPREPGWSHTRRAEKGQAHSGTTRRNPV